MRNIFELAALLLFFCCGALPAQEQFLQAEPGKEAFYALYNKALSAHTTSKFREAETAYLAAMKEAQKSPGPSWDYGRTVSLLAIAYHIHGYPQWAERFYLESLAYGEGENSNPAWTITSVDGLGRLYLQENKLAKAAPLLERALKIQMLDEKKSEEKYGTADLLSALAGLYEKQGKKKTAGSYYLQAVGLFKNKETAFPFRVLNAELMDSYPIILYKTGEFYRTSGDEASANYYYGRALRAWSNWSDMDSRPALKARVLDYRGRTLKALGRAAAAAGDLNDALRLYKSMYNAQDPRIAEAAAQLASIKK